MRNKLIWFYQEVDEPESSVQQEPPKPGPSRTTGTSNSSKTPQGNRNLFHFGRSEAGFMYKHHSINSKIDYFLIQGATPAGPVFKHKLFLTDGWNCAFNGICVYIFRLNTTKPLPEEGFQKDL